MSTDLDVNNLKALAQATPMQMKSLSPLQQDTAIQKIFARTSGKEQPTSETPRQKADIPPSEVLTDADLGILAEHLEVLKNYKRKRLGKEIEQFIPDPEPDLTQKNFSSGAWFIRNGADPGTYVLIVKESDKKLAPPHPFELEELIKNGLTLEKFVKDELKVKAKDYAGPKPWAGYMGTAKKIAALAIGALAVGATAFLLSRGGAPAAAPQGPKLQPVPQVLPQPHVWNEWTYAPAEELPVNCSQVCDLSQEMWRGLAETPVAIPEWIVNSLSQASSYTALPPDAQLRNAAECLGRVSRFDEHTPIRTLRQGLNEVAMRGEAFAPIAYCVRGGDPVLAQLDQQQTRLRTLVIERDLRAGESPEKAKTQKPSESSETSKTKAPTSAQQPKEPPKHKEAKPAEPKPAEKPLSAAEMIQTYTSKSRALVRAKNEAMRLPGQDTQKYLKEIEGKRTDLDKWKSDQLDAIKRNWTARTKAIQTKYQELKGKGKELTVEDIDPIITELSELEKDIEATEPHLPKEVLNPHRDRIHDIRQNFVRLSSSLYRLKSIDQMVRSASSLSTAPKAAAQPNPYFTQQEASEQSVPKQTPIDTLFHDSVALQGQLDSGIRQTTKLLEQTEPLTHATVDSHHMKVAAKLSTLEKQVQAHYKGIHDQKSNDLSLADPPENQASFDKAIALTRIGLAKSVIQQLTSDKIATAEKRPVRERAITLLNEAEAAVQANVREQDRGPLLHSIQELRGQIPKLGAWDYAMGMTWWS